MTIQVNRYQKGKTSLDFTEAKHSEWQWHQLGHMQVCTLLQTDNHASTPPLRFLRAGCPSCHPTNSVKAPIARVLDKSTKINLISTRSDTHQKLAAGNCEQQVRFSRTASYRSKTFQVLTKTSSVFKHLQVHFSLKN